MCVLNFDSDQVFFLCFSQVLPLSLQAFVSACRHFALPRKQLIKETNDHGKKISNGGHVEHNFRKHVKLKKQYEVKCLSQVLIELNCMPTVVYIIGSEKCSN